MSAGVRVSPRCPIRPGFRIVDVARRVVFRPGGARWDTATPDSVLDCEDPTQLAKCWREALDYRDYYTDANLGVLVPEEGIGSPVLLQGVPEPKVGKNHMHVDFVVDNVEAEVHRLQALGVRRIDDGVQASGEPDGFE